MAEAYFLSAKDRETIKRVVDDYLGKRGNTTGRPREGHVDHEEHQAPQLYVALTPEDGIPGLDIAPPETGTGTGTGGDVFVGDDIPGYATCNIYRVVPTVPLGDTSTPALEPITGLTKTVYNTSAISVPGYTWIIVARDSFGSWLVVTPPADRMLVRLIGKAYPVSGYRQYYWEEVRDSSLPTLLSFYTTGLVGGPGNFPALDIMDVDYPIPHLVFVRKGRGDYWLIENEPRIEIVRIADTTLIDDLYASGYLQVWDQSGKVFVDSTPVLIVDANG